MFHWLSKVGESEMWPIVVQIKNVVKIAEGIDIALY